MPKGYSKATGEPLRPPERRFTADEQRRGQAAQAERHRGRRAMREVFEALLDMPMAPGGVGDVLSLAEAEGVNVTVSQAIALAMARKAVDGDVQAAAFIRDTSGNKPVEQVELTRPDTEAARELAAMVDRIAAGTADG